MSISPKILIQNTARAFGYEFSKIQKRVPHDAIIDADERFMKIYNACNAFTMTNKERMYGLYLAVVYVVNARITGDLVECGVWRGGNTMLMALTLKALNDESRSIFLYDTFEGMAEPSVDDASMADTTASARVKWQQDQKDNHNEWCYAPLEEVKKNMAATGYPEHKLYFIQGKVEDTIPATMPKNVALLRLDTDWYESTKHELMHLYPLLASHGVLILDDYGTWAGAKKAVDEYFAGHPPLLLNRLDKEARIGIKMA